VHASFETSRDFGVDVLAVVSLNEGSLIEHYTIFGPNDRDNALVELDVRSGASGTDPFRVHTERYVRALNERDWAGVLAMVAPDVTVVDRRPASVADATDAETFVGNSKAFVDLVPSLIVERFDVPAVSAESGVMRLTCVGANEQGGRIEFEFLAVAIFEGGLIRRYEFFAPDAVEAAVARLHELSA
jgi:hypothetical protein